MRLHVEPGPSSPRGHVGNAAVGSQGQERRQLGASRGPVAGTRRDECCVSRRAEQGPLEEEGNADR